MQSFVGRGHILVVEDSASTAQMYQGILEADGYQVTLTDSAEGAQELLESNSFDVTVLDVELPGISGLELLERLGSGHSAGAIIMVTGHGSVEVAVQAMARGAFDFIEKPVVGPRLKLTVANASRQMALQSQVSQLRRSTRADGFESFVGTSSAMRSVYEVIQSAAASSAPVFVVGESGTGKELCAEAIHKQSGRSGGPMVVLNCAAIPKDLMESEIFGHVKGAFTGATSDRVGAAERANGGTLFLDEICEMDIDLQSKLLRFLQTGAIQKVGGAKTKHVDVRIVCATNRDPVREVSEGRFREDLYYRLYVIPVRLPPLRDREGDSVMLAEHFLINFAREEGKRFRSFETTAAQWISNHRWPGNVRELQNFVRQLVVFNDGESVTLGMIERLDLVVPKPLAPNTEVVPLYLDATPSQQFSGDLQDAVSHEPPEETPYLQPLWQSEKAIIERVIEHFDGQVHKAAKLLEISPSTIYRKKQAWEKLTVDGANGG